jgi:hypothetical protein
VHVDQARHQSASVGVDDARLVRRAQIRADPGDQPILDQNLRTRDKLWRPAVEDARAANEHHLRRPRLRHEMLRQDRSPNGRGETGTSVEVRHGMVPRFDLYRWMTK